jgi:hypothetical protein
MALPIMTPEQRAAGLAKAAESRQKQSELLGRLKAGSISLGEVLQSDDAVTGRIRVLRAVKAVPGIGAVKAAAALTEAGIQENRRVGGLTPGQRERLLQQVGS